LHAGHFARSSPGWPKMNILPIVLHKGHIPVVTFFGPVFMIFWVFRLPILVKFVLSSLLNLVLILEFSNHVLYNWTHEKLTND
jgi:hypothetical protein